MLERHYPLIVIVKRERLPCVDVLSTFTLAAFYFAHCSAKICGSSEETWSRKALAAAVIGQLFGTRSREPQVSGAMQ